jgi:Rrf2 family nitric oxide-sensitive transcriptional repressor
VVSRLARAGYLVGTRGRTGGIRLAVAPSRINVGDVLRVIEPSFGRNIATDRQEAAGPFDAVVRAAIESFVATFDTFTIADLAGDPATGRIACLDCDLHSLVRRGRALSRSRQSAKGPAATRNAAVRAA